MSEAAAWTVLEDELARWGASGRAATIWWRDDDAIEPTPALDRMLGLAGRHAAPLGLAVIPAAARPGLAGRLAGETLVEVLPHGYAHTNHAPPGERAAEFAAHRPLAERARELADGWRRLAAFVRRTPIFVPPWNRYADDLAPALEAAGLLGISGFGTGKKVISGTNTVVLNTHCDIIQWRGTRGFCGTAKAIGAIVDHLAARREGRTDADEATGLLTHHLVHDEASWLFLADLLARLAAHRSVRWLTPGELLKSARGRAMLA